MAIEKKDYGVDFVNIELSFPPRLYMPRGMELPDGNFLFAWLEKMERDYYKTGGSYNERSRSFTASITNKGGKVDERPKTVTQHGKSKISANQKLYIIFEVCGGWKEGLDVAQDRIEELEGLISEAVDKIE